MRACEKNQTDADDDYVSSLIHFPTACTAEGCNKTGANGGRALPASFCRMCLKNRHGEDIDAAVASGQWTCPKCRGSCGAGCTTCCNCGPCRKSNALEPTGILVLEARKKARRGVLPRYRGVGPRTSTTKRALHVECHDNEIIHNSKKERNYF